ncbi:MAG: J domain-containing protein [Alphaproteobacteria bacterium]|nr:MAG: J domain-containing protein [Alphaproteobacteria bacterium]
MAFDPYAALGVSKTATADEIKKAYRRIVKSHHPDLNPDDKAAEEKFKAASAAYDLLKDPEKRARFDRGEIDEMGNETPQYQQRQYYRDFAEAGANPYRQGARYEDFDAEDIFAEFLRGRGGRSSQGFAGHGFENVRLNGADVRYRLEVPFLDAARGGSTRITLPDGAALEVKIPRGIGEGQTIRLRGKGQPGINGGAPGDALITVHIAPHPVFSREGNDIRVVLPIGIDEAVLGAKVPVPTIDGKVNMTIPKGANSGQVLRLKGRGVKPPRGPAGDQLVELKIVTPPKIDDDLARCMKEWQAKHGFDPRRGMKA